MRDENTIRGHLNRFNFMRKLSFNKNLKLVKHIEYIKFDDNVIKPKRFCLRSHKNDKKKPLKDKIRVRPQTSLKIGSNEQMFCDS